jgi:hypothetical protein
VGSRSVSKKRNMVTAAKESYLGVQGRRRGWG